MTKLRAGDKVEVLFTNEELYNLNAYGGEHTKGDIIEIQEIAQGELVSSDERLEEGGCWIPVEAVRPLLPRPVKAEDLFNTKFVVTEKQRPHVIKFLRGLGFKTEHVDEKPFQGIFLYTLEVNCGWSRAVDGHQLYYKAHENKEINIMDYMTVPEKPLSEWVPQLIKAGLEGKVVYYGDSESDVFKDALHTLTTGLDKEDTYSIHDPKDEIRDEIASLQEMIKELEAKLT